VEYLFGEYNISNDKSLLSIQSVKELLSQSYWANRRPAEVIQASVNNSDCYGVYHKNKQVGFARVVSDNSTVFWLCDVIIDENYRGKGIGKALVKKIVESEAYKNLTGILITDDAHSLYQQFGFVKAPEGKFMMR
jgi:GNAT superfamily N-acetyltransferase